MRHAMTPRRSYFLRTALAPSVGRCEEPELSGAGDRLGCGRRAWRRCSAVCPDRVPRRSRIVDRNVGVGGPMPQIALYEALDRNDRERREQLDRPLRAALGEVDRGREDRHLGPVAVLLGGAVERGECANAELRELGARPGPLVADGLRARCLRPAREAVVLEDLPDRERAMRSRPTSRPGPRLISGWSSCLLEPAISPVVAPCMSCAVRPPAAPPRPRRRCGLFWRR